MNAQNNIIPLDKLLAMEQANKLSRKQKAFELKDPNAPATSKQLYSLFCSFNKLKNYNKRLLKLGLENNLVNLTYYSKKDGSYDRSKFQEITKKEASGLISSLIDIQKQAGIYVTKKKYFK